MKWTKPACLAVAAFLVASSVTWGSEAVTWSANRSISFLYNPTGSAITPGVSGTFLIQLVIDVGGDDNFGLMGSQRTVGVGSDAGNGTVFASSSAMGNGSANDLVIGSGTWSTDGSGVMSAGATTSTAGIDSQQFYFRWFNNSTEASATAGGIIYSSNGSWLTPAGPASPTAVVDFSFGTANVGATQFSGVNGLGYQGVVPAPEPGTVGLLAVGLLTIAARRRARN